MDFEQEKQQLVVKINQQNELIDGLVSQNYKVGLLNGEQLASLEEIKSKNQKYVHKLISNEFEIAIVGLEKAGKSTFANALIKSSVLPSAPERCTFTSTRLVSGGDKATVQFYTETEFEEIFQALLEEIEFYKQDPVPASTSGATGWSEKEENQLYGLRKRLKGLHENPDGIQDAKKRAETIDRLKAQIAAFEARNSGDSLSSVPSAHHEAVSFRKLSLADFERYFQSLEEKNPSLYKNHVGKTDEEIKDILSVKDRLRLDGKTLTFSGQQLKSDDFQSFIKGEQKGKDTAKPRSVKRIEIESSELSQLKNAIIYDVPGFDSPTKIHMRQTEERLKAADAIILVTNIGANPNLQATTLGVITKNTDEDGIKLSDKLFVFGNRLDQVNNEKDIEGNVRVLEGDVEKYKIGERRRVFAGSAYKYLSEQGIVEAGSFKHDVDSKVEQIREALTDYYKTERFQILKRKVNTNQQMLHRKLEDVLAGLDLTEVVSQDSEQAKITKTAYKAIEERLENELQKLRDVLKKEIYDEEYFSKKFQHEVQNRASFEEISEEDFERIRILKDDSIRLDLPVNRINHTIREAVHKQYLEDFNQLIKSMTDHKVREVEVRLLQTFKSAIAGDSLSVESTIEPLCKKYVHKVTHEVAHGENSFTYLLERFSRDVFDGLLSFPVLSQDRKNRYLQCVNEYVYLDSFYSRGTGELINILLSQKNQRLLSADKDSLLKIVAALLSHAKQVSATAAVIEKLVEMSAILKDTSPLLMVKEHSGVEKILEGAVRSNSEADVLKEINLDISNLKQVLIRAVIPAANMELAFINSVDKQIKRLIAAFKTRESHFADDWDTFISKVVPIIKENEFAHINDRIETYKIRQQLVEKIQQALA